MSTTTNRDATAARGPAQRLRAGFSAVRLSFNWLGVRKTLSSEQRAQAADTFGAEEAFLSAGKKILETRHPVYKALTAIRGRATQYWRHQSLPYPEPGLRLIRQDQIEEFARQMATFREELYAAVQELDAHYAELKSAARERLGSLFDESDYPASLAEMFAIEWSFPSVEPPDYLLQLNPQLYEQECQRVAAQFDDAVRLAEEAFLAELGRLVEHLSERLSGGAAGKPRVFRDSAVDNLTEFFARFQNLNIRSNEQLEQLVGQAQQVIRGVAPQELRDSQQLRQQVTDGLTRVQSMLDGLLVDRPRRNILRRPR